MAGEIEAVMLIVKSVSDVINGINERHKAEVARLQEEIAKLQRAVAELRPGPK